MKLFHCFRLYSVIIALCSICASATAAAVYQTDSSKTEDILYISKIDDHLNLINDRRAFRKGDKFLFKLENDKKFKIGRIDKIDSDSISIISSYREGFKKIEKPAQSYAIADIRQVRRKNQYLLLGAFTWGFVWSLVVTVIAAIVLLFAFFAVIATLGLDENINRFFDIIFNTVIGALIGAMTSLIGMIASAIPSHFKIGKRWRIQRLKRLIDSDKKSK